MSNSAFIPNPVMGRMQTGQPALDMSLRMGHSGEIVHIAKAIRDNFVFVDVLHSLFDLGTVGRIAQVALARGIAPI